MVMLHLQVRDYAKELLKTFRYGDNIISLYSKTPFTPATMSKQQ